MEPRVNVHSGQDCIRIVAVSGEPPTPDSGNRVSAAMTHPLTSVEAGRMASVSDSAG